MELATDLQLEKYKKGEVIINQGEKGDKFYVIIQGIVGINKRNPKVTDWKVKNQDLKYLMNWKKNVFDPKCEEFKNKVMGDLQQQNAAEKQKKEKYIQIQKDMKNSRRVSQIINIQASTRLSLKVNLDKS